MSASSLAVAPTCRRRLRDRRRSRHAGARGMPRRSHGGCARRARPRRVGARSSARAPRSTACPLTVRRARRAAPSSSSARRAILRAVNSLAALATELQSTWHREIPLAAAIDVRGRELHGRRELVVRAPLAAESQPSRHRVRGQLVLGVRAHGLGNDVARAAAARASRGVDRRRRQPHPVSQSRDAARSSCRCSAEARRLDASVRELRGDGPREACRSSARSTRATSAP